MMYKKEFSRALLIFLSFGFSIAVLSGAVDALSGSEFVHGRIIDDSVFRNTTTMSVQQIQTFLEAKVNGGTCDRYRTTYNSNYNPPWTCLFEFEQNPTTGANNYGQFNSDGSPASVSGGQSAAQIIWQAGQDYNINPQVLIVLLQKEQGLVTDNWPWTIQYSKATGYNCPDTAPCNPASADFVKQVRGAAWSFNYYIEHLDSYWYGIGSNDILYNPNTACGRKTINIENAATVALYLYTPYTPNQAALDNLYGTGDSCSAYGNRNFWRYFNDWFGSTSASPFFRIDDSTAVYILGENDTYYQVPNQTILKAYGYGTTIGKIDNYPSTYLSGKTFAGHLSLTARFEGSAIYLIDRGKRRQFGTRELYEDTYGYVVGGESRLPAGHAAYFDNYSQMQSIIKEYQGPGIYLVEEGKTRHFIDSQAYDSGSPAYSSLPNVQLTSEYINSFEPTTPVIAPGKVIRNSANGERRYWDGNTSYKLTSSVYIDTLNVDYQLSADGFGLLGISAGSLGNRLFDGLDYYLVDSKLLRLSATQIDENSINTASFATAPNGFINKFGITDLESDAFRIDGSQAIFSLRSGELKRYLDKQAIGDNGIDISKVRSLRSTTANIFTNSGALIIANDTLYRLNSTSSIYIVNQQGSSYKIPSRAILDAHLLTFDSVYDLSAVQVADYPSLGNLGFFAQKQTSQVWLIDGQRRYVDDNAKLPQNYSLNLSEVPVFDDSHIAKLKSSPPLNVILRSTNGPKIFKIENGQKRWITSLTALQNEGYSMNDVLVVSDNFINSLSNGTNIY